jgi:hypothetical protein
MKKMIIPLSLIVTMLAVSACGGTQDMQVNMVTGGTAGTYFPFGGAMAAVIERNTGISVMVMSSGASADNIRQIAAGDAHMAIAQNDVMNYAFNGSEIWAEYEPVKTMATLMSLYPETVQIIVPADSDIHGVADLAGKRVSVGDVGSGVEANAVQVLNVYGLTADDITVINLGFGGSTDAMRDLQLDAFFVTAATPNIAVSNLSAVMDLRILSLPDHAVQTLMNSYPFYVQVTIDSNDYSFLTEPVNTVGVKATLVASANMSEQMAYDIVKTLIEHQSEIDHARGAQINAQSAVKSVSVNFHPGALRYYREIGVLN